MGRPAAWVLLLTAPLALGALAACTRPLESDEERTAHVVRWLADLDGDRITAARAETALAALGPEDAAAVPALMAALSCPVVPSGSAPPVGQEHGDHEHGECNDHIVLAAAAGLGAIGGAAVEPVLARLRAGDEPNRTFASYALGRMRVNAVPALLQALTDPDPRIRIAVIGSIRSMEQAPMSALPALALRLTDTDVDVRVQAADTLGRFGIDAVPSIVRALADVDPRVRASAASALRLVGPAARDRAPLLRTHLTDTAAPVRLNAAAALAAVKADDTETVRALIDALADPDPTVRAGAVLALDKLGKAADARPALEKARGDASPLVSSAANETLAALGNSRP